MATALGSPTRSCGAYRAAESRGGYVFSWPAMPQDPLYHQFADRRSILGIANGLNVLSNIPFLLVGIAGCRAVLASARRSALHAQWLMWPYLLVQDGSLALIMLLLHLYPARWTHTAFCGRAWRSMRPPRCSSPPTIKSSGSGR